MRQKLGEGALATVHVAEHRATGKQYAVKCINKVAHAGRADLKWVAREVDVMRRLDHPNVVPIIDAYDEEEHIYIVLEFMEDGELFHYIVNSKEYTEDNAREVVSAIAKALHYLHSQNMVHRDLKPENVLLATRNGKRVIKLADFGYARFVASTGMNTQCGTKSYLAPEVIRGTTYYDKVDLWALGVIMYIMLCGRPPFRHRNQVRSLFV